MESEYHYDVLISIIIPVYNVQSYLEECLDSLLNQDFKEWEAICIDDCSTDGSKIILDSYAAKDSRIRVVGLPENGGLSHARNCGFDAAIGRYVCYLDSDDMLKDGCLARLKPYIEAESLEMLTYEIGGVKFDIQLENNGNMYQLKNDYSTMGIAPGRQFMAAMVENGEFYNNVVFALYERRWLQRAGIRFKEKMYYEDGPYTLSCYLACERMRHVRVGVYIRRYRADSITTGNTLTFSHAYSLLWCYENSLRLYYQTTTLNQREKACLLCLIESNMHEAYNRAAILPWMEYLKFQNLVGLPRIMAEGLSIVETCNNPKLYVDGLHMRVINSKEIYLYGSGEIGSLTWSYLQSDGLGQKIKGFVDSNRKCGKSKYGLPVFCIADIHFYEGSLLILSASTKYQMDMRQSAASQGFEADNIIGIDSLLLCHMRHALECKLKKATN